LTFWALEIGPLSMQKRVILIMKTQAIFFLVVLVGLIPDLHAHHNLRAEFGPFESETVYAEGRIVGIKWGNPHVAINIEITGGELAVGEKWQLQGHALQGMTGNYGFSEEDFVVGKNIRVHGYLNLRGRPVLFPRALQVEDGPMRSAQRYRDFIDIANGVFEDTNIVPPNLNGATVTLLDQEIVQRLGEMGLLDESGRMIWPAPE